MPTQMYSGSHNKFKCTYIDRLYFHRMSISLTSQNIIVEHECQFHMP